MNKEAAKPLAPPMMDFVGIAAVLGSTHKHARSLVDGGQIYPAFDIRAGKVRLIRAYRLAVENFAAGRDFKLTFEDMVDALGLKTEAVPAPACYSWLNCNHKLIYKLISLGEIKSSSWRNGAYNAARINVESLLNFLRRRLLKTPAKS